MYVVVVVRRLVRRVGARWWWAARDHGCAGSGRSAGGRCRCCSTRRGGCWFRV